MASNRVSVQVVGDSKDLQRAFKDAEQSSKSFAATFRNDTQILGHWAKRGAQAIGAIAAAVVGISVKGGIDRLMGLERANKQLSQLGVEGKAADGLMESLLDTLLGTPFALDKGAASLAGFVASGRDLDDIPRLIQQVTDAAAFGNTTLEEVDFIWQRIQTTGRVTNKELRMLAERNIPVYTQLAAAFELTAAEVFDMASNGELSADMFFDAWQKAAEGTVDGTVRIAGAAKSMGETTSGAWANMRTAMSRFGATLLEDVFPLAKEVFTAIGEGFDRMGQIVSAAFSDFDSSEIEDFIERIPDMMADATQGVIDFWEATETARDVAGAAFVGISEVLTNKVLLAVGAVVGALALLYAHPVIAGLGLVATLIGTIATRTDEARRVGRDLAETWEELSVAARMLQLTDLFGPEQTAYLESHGVALSDLADGTLTYADALAQVEGKGDFYLGIFPKLFGVHQEAEDSLRGLAEGTEEHAEALEDLAGRTMEAEDAALNKARADRHQADQQDAANEATGESIPLTQDQTDALDDAADSQKDLAKETESATDALKRQNDELRALTDPAFALFKANQDLTQSQLDYAAAVDEFKADSPEAIEAAGRIADATYDLRDALIEVGTNGIDPLTKQLQSLGIPDSTINAIIGDAKRIEEYFRNMVLRIAVSAPSLFPTQPASGGIGWRSETRQYFQEGGITTEGFLDGNRSRRKEAILPLETAQGRRALASAIAEAMPVAGSGITLNVYAGLGTNGHEVGEQIVEVIEKARRRGVAV